MKSTFIGNMPVWLLLAAWPLNGAVAMSGPQPMTVDGGPLGALQFSGGVDGFSFVNSNPDIGDKTAGAALSNALLTLQKNRGILQFTIEVGATSAQTLGYAPITAAPGANYFPQSPLYAGFITIAPKPDFSISLGQLSPLVGFENAQDWNNANLFFSQVAYTEPAQGRGGQVEISAGPIVATASLTDGYYTGVVNYLQWIFTYTPDTTNSISLFGGANLGKTGANVRGTGNILLDNSNLFGIYYTYTLGNVSLTPEIQYQYASRDAALGLGAGVNDLSLALFGNYQFGSNAPWSVGGFVEYAAEGYRKAALYRVSPDFFGFGPGSDITGISITPTWQGQNLFVRGDVGFVHVNRGGGGKAFGAGDAADQVSLLMEAGVLF